MAMIKSRMFRSQKCCEVSFEFDGIKVDLGTYSKDQIKELIEELKFITKELEYDFNRMEELK